jgi:hypothetical protein
MGTQVNPIGLIGEGSDAVNDQLVPRYSIDGVDPLIFGGTALEGLAAYPQQGVYQIPPVPPAISDMAGQSTIMSGAAYGGGQAGGGQVTKGIGGSAQAPTIADASGNVMSLTKGPVIMALLFLVVALAGLQWIHWRK